MTKYINLFGGPGIGKSTAAAELFVRLKKEGLKVELVTEVAKDFVWEDRGKTLSIQPYVTVKQYRNLKRLQGEVDVVVTDAPVILGAIFGKLRNPELPSCWVDFVLWMHNDLSPTNFLLTRKYEFKPEGRLEDEESAKAVDIQISDFLRKHNIETKSYEKLRKKF